MNTDYSYSKYYKITIVIVITLIHYFQDIYEGVIKPLEILNYWNIFHENCSTTILI